MNAEELSECTNESFFYLAVIPLDVLLYSCKHSLSMFTLSSQSKKLNVAVSATMFTVHASTFALWVRQPSNTRRGPQIQKLTLVLLTVKRNILSTIVAFAPHSQSIGKLSLVVQAPARSNFAGKPALLASSR
jgi:hypothetical protein